MKNLLSVSLIAITMSFATAAFATESAPIDAAAPQYNFRLSYEDTEHAVSNALAEKGAGKKVAAQITSGNRKEALYSYDKPIDVEIRGLRYEKAGSWSANILFLSEGEVISAMPIAGRFEEVVAVPTLKQAVRAGEVIAPDNVEMRDYPVSRTRLGTLLSADELVGKTPQRIISAGRPVRDAEIGIVNIVKKNSVVQMRYSLPGMEITASGQAMADGSKGQVVSVRNLTSKKLVYAVVENAGTVTVLPAGAAPQQVSQLTAQESLGGSAYEAN